MSFVFISHASPDKPLIRHIVDALIADGQKVWLDNPAALGYSEDDIQRHFMRLHTGGRWLDEIDEAIREGLAVLVCFSKRYNEPRDVWHDEVAVARNQGTLVACRIDDVDPQSLRNQYSTQQMPDLRPELADTDRKRALALLVEDVRRMMERTGRKRLERRKNRSRCPDAPYLVNRVSHEIPISEGMATVKDGRGVHAFIVAGPENECVDEFIDRLRKHICKKHFGLYWHHLEVDWPKHQRRSGFDKAYLFGCASGLGTQRRPVAPNEAAIAEALSRTGKPIALISRMTAAEWQGDEHRRLSDWLELWHRIARQSDRFSAFPILSLKMPRADPGWDECPAGTAPDASMSNFAIWRAISALRKSQRRWVAWPSASSPDWAAIKIPPLLHPVDRGDADTWLERLNNSGQLDHDVKIARAAVAAAYDGRKAIPLETFALRMQPLFQGGTAA